MGHYDVWDWNMSWKEDLFIPTWFSLNPLASAHLLFYRALITRHLLINDEVEGMKVYSGKLTGGLKGNKTRKQARAKVFLSSLTSSPSSSFFPPLPPFFFLETGSYCVALAGMGLLCRLGWPWTHEGPLAPEFQSSGIKEPPCMNGLISYLDFNSKTLVFYEWTLFSPEIWGTKRP